MSNQLIVMRTEKKYEISHFTVLKLKNMLQASLKEDKFNNIDGYLVRSLYFDTVYDNDYWDKENGLENRRKIRLRTYNPASEKLKLELKEKKGENQIKRSLIIDKCSSKRLINGDYSVLREIDTELSNELFYIMQTNLYRPKCIVEYNRLAYMVPENNIRITIDTNIKSTESSYDIFSTSLGLYNVTEQNVLEVKYNNFLLSYVKDIIDIADKSEISASKYCISRSISYI